MKTFIKFWRKIFVFISFTILIFSSASYAQNMNDYCITPPFIVAGVKPNLLLMLDNSASMLDLAYVDKGTSSRQAYYCVDETYRSGNEYAGYFDKVCSDSCTNKDNCIFCKDDTDCPSGKTCVDTMYEYDFSENYFYTPATTTTCSGETKSIDNTLLICIDKGDPFIDDDDRVTNFVAKGNYLNWLTSSKFDVQKQILTGGKYAYDSDLEKSFMIAETRGCVGRKFIKEPLTSDFIEYSDPNPDPNTSLGITFGIRGPKHPYNEAALSLGGLTEIDIFYGDYDVSGKCADAINDIVVGEDKQTIIEDLEECLVYYKGKTCSLDPSTPCNNDSDCAGTAGTCDIINDGVCTAESNGICSITTAGVCTPDNGTCNKVCIGGSNAGAACNRDSQCDSNVCSKICIGGGKAGSACNNDNDCRYSSCTSGKVGNLCSVNSDCDLKTCTSGNIGDSCIVNADCNTKTCTEPPSKVGDPCNVDTDCNSGTGTCTEPPSKVGAPCVVDTDCSVGYKGVCLQPVTQQIKSTFAQSMHSCYQYWEKGTDPGENEYQQVTNPAGCNQIYLEYKICNGGAKDGLVCSTSADCTGGGTCVHGPDHIRPGNAAYLCSSKYAGYCATTSDNWETTVFWVAREYPSARDCVLEKYKEFCGAVAVPPVIDPSDDPSTTEKYDNLPAIIADMGVEAQLGKVIGNLKVKIYRPTAPSGLIKEFEDLIHFGAMKFNDYGSNPTTVAESSIIPRTKVCQNNTTLTCSSNSDCPGGDCIEATSLDGGKVISHIEGRCSADADKICSVDSDCFPDDGICEYTVGDHSSGLIAEVNNIFASTWTPFAEGFYNAIGFFANRNDICLNNPGACNDFDIAKNPVQYRCQKNNVLLITDGMSTADLNSSVTSLVSSYNDGDGQIDSVASATCPKFAGSRNIDDLAWLAKNKDIKDFTKTPPATDVNSRTITTYVVFNGVGTEDPGECNPDLLMRETAENGGGTYQRAENPDELERALREAFLMIAGQAASGTAASVLATGEGSGANLVQAIFYPEITFPSSNKVNWIGTLKNIWYYIDPFLGSSTIREDTSEDKILSLTVDDIVTFYFDTDSNTTKARLFRDIDGDSKPDSEDTSRGSPVYFENVRSLWEAGAKLWVRSPDDRVIYTTTDGNNITEFETGNAATLRTHLRAGSDEEAKNIISYVRGYDYKYCSTSGNTCSLDSDCPAGETCTSPRNRITKLDLNGDGDTLDTINGISENVERVYKLGDIVNSTPRIVSYVPLNNYYKTYQDTTYKEFTETDDYKKNRGIVLVGANDGMLHAFRLGKIEMFEEKSKKATISDTDLDNLGKEEWAFIPHNVLPYLKYIRENDYCHLYYTDLTPYVLDASICAPGDCSGDYWDKPKTKDSWRTIVIGGMRLGGACKNSCTSDINADGDINSEDCVITPTSDTGYSSYFALDITNPTNPQLLWEFTNPSLGYSTTGPAIVRIAGKTDATKSEDLDKQMPDHNKNGRWFVVVGSGPTGPIETETHQFYGHSDQNMKVFIIDLKDGTLVKTIDSGIQYAFAGSMVNGQADFDMDNLMAQGFYQDDAVYFGFTKAENNPPLSTTRWNSGGVMRLFTKNSLNPDDWVLSKVIDNIGPVTSAVARLQNFKTNDVWLFWGTGRYYFKIADIIDDSDTRRSLYGVKDPCFYGDAGVHFDCEEYVTLGELDDATSSGIPETRLEDEDYKGWHIDLDLCTDKDEDGNIITVPCASTSTSGYKTERNVTDPLATPIGAVFFTTTKPAADVCSYGGASHLWVVYYKTGGAVSSSILRGKALLQVSTGSIEEIALEKALTEKGGRRTPMIEGVPPTGAPPGILIPPDPVNRILHIRER